MFQLRFIIFVGNRTHGRAIERNNEWRKRNKFI